MKKKILDASSKLFLQYGIKSVSMADIARDLAISKKTVYTHFENKEDIVHEGMSIHLLEEEEFVRDIIKEYPNPIDQFLNIQKHVSEYLRTLNPSTIYDLSKYYKKTWDLFEAHKHQFLYKSIIKNLEDGIKAKLYRDDFEVDIVARIYVGGVDAIFNNTVFPIGKYPFYKVHYQYVMYHLNAIVSDKGKKYLNKKRAEQS